MSNLRTQLDYGMLFRDIEDARGELGLTKKEFEAAVRMPKPCWATVEGLAEISYDKLLYLCDMVGIEISQYFRRGDAEDENIR